MRQYLTLILNNTHIKVNRKKLASKSQYFASLFSHNFCDSNSEEHVINYDISLCTLQTFVYWVHDKNHMCVLYQPIKVSLTKFLQKNFKGLLALLQLSVLFMVDELISDIIEIIVSYWLDPQKVIDIWLLAQELGVKVLQDVCVSLCLDRFEELPLSSLIKLNADNIVKLLNNVNLRYSSEFYLQHIREQWMKYHKTNLIDVKGERKLKFIKTWTVIHESDQNDQKENYGIKNAYLYMWDGNVLNERVKLKCIEHPNTWLFGAQVVTRGFSVYTIGGCVGLESAQFNKIISRYCLLSKKWYYEAHLPVPRRHMIAVFLSNKLILVGGVGKHRLKLSSVDILNIHTGNWTSGPHIPECFTSVPPYCVKSGKLFVLKSSFYIYYPEENIWNTISIPGCNNIGRVDAFITHDTTLLFSGIYLDGKAAIIRTDIIKNESVCEKPNCMIQPVLKRDKIFVNSIKADSKFKFNIYVLILPDTRKKKGSDLHFHVHADVNNDFKNATFPRFNSSNIIDPNTLYNIL
ncbi:hypothetical protein K0M31_000310 [Melipona bicolor]|uniref:BTB domain-containing protein n=1 Tax=Melipona bicolor TaxID=60889 RepID=A0AA40GEK2_9HYME|nr:hypothetical protein K0M31_000310 [Melipona bicolor]